MLITTASCFGPLWAARLDVLPRMLISSDVATTDQAFPDMLDACFDPGKMYDGTKKLFVRERIRRVSLMELTRLISVLLSSGW